MANITAIIIAKNEEENIADCLDSVAFCDERLVIDGGSTDKTVAIVEKMGAIVISHPFTDFASARNQGLRHAKGEWILYIDADERVDNVLQKNILEAIKKQDEFAAYKVQRKNFYLGNHEWPKIEQMERLFQKKHLREWYGTLHESPKVTGEIGILEGFLLHYTHQNLSLMVSKTNMWSNVEAKLRFDTHHPKMVWWRFPRVMIGAFYDSYITQKGYKVGIVGLIESIYQAFSIFITYAKLWEMQQDHK
jgi:glycosyltransferase involved in cell wall biosynthesis